ncbi:MAG TPA: divergent polysaccharide deacetylase family protein, partial [Fibrobacteria bacterium]|nr:divergent polysaccharide deacetylase family protein [Fibrobacteria bacterium]
MKTRRFLWILIAVALLAGLGLLSGRLFSRAEEKPAETAAPAALDSATRAAWEKGAPALFKSDTLAAFRDKILLPFAIGNGAVPRGVKRRGGFIEATFPRGRPLYTLAHELETRATQAGFRVAEGREIGSKADAAEYLLLDETGRAYALRLLIGQTEAPGFFRMALVITDAGRASAADRKAWLAFPFPVTLVFPDTVEAPDDGASTDSRDVLVELPMEPAAYPVVKPGPRALFIHHTKDEIER